MPLFFSSRPSLGIVLCANQKLETKVCWPREIYATRHIGVVKESVFHLVIGRVNLPPILVFLLCKMHLWIPPYFIVYKSATSLLNFFQERLLLPVTWPHVDDGTRRYRRWEWHSIYCNLCTLVMWKGRCMAKEVHIFDMDAKAKIKVCLLWRNSLQRIL